MLTGELRSKIDNVWNAFWAADEPHIPQATVANKPGHRGEREGNR